MKWQEYLKKKNTLFFYISSHLYTLLFILAVLATPRGFLLVVKKKRGYVDKEGAQPLETLEDSKDQQASQRTIIGFLSMRGIAFAKRLVMITAFCEAE